VRNELENCLYCIEKFTEFPYELVIVDDGSEDMDVSEFAEEKATTFIRHEKTEGIAKSRYDAVLASKGDYICTLDSDTIVTPYWLQTLVNKYEVSQSDDFKVYILGGMVSCWLGFFINNHDYHIEKGLIECSEIGTACMLFERNLIDLIGNFDPELYNLLSDLDFCRRIHELELPGVKPKVCITPEVIVYHHGWVDPLTGRWVVTLGQSSTRGQAKFITREWQLKKLHSMEILNKRWGVVQHSLEAMRKEYNTDSADMI
jgi:GT2 family glycosyltransferase